MDTNFANLTLDQSFIESLPLIQSESCTQKIQSVDMGYVMTDSDMFYKIRDIRYNSVIDNGLEVLKALKNAYILQEVDKCQKRICT